MAQRAIDAITTLPENSALELRRWLVGVGGEALLSLDAPRLERDGLQARFSSATRNRGTAHAT
jgi:hypothetical protein